MFLQFKTILKSYARPFIPVDVLYLPFRYLAIVLEQGLRFKLRTVKILIASLWIAAISISLFPILFWGKYYDIKKSPLCKPRDGVFMIFLTVVAFFIPLSIMVFCYVSIFLKVQQHKQIIAQSMGEPIGLMLNIKPLRLYLLCLQYLSFFGHLT